VTTKDYLEIVKRKTASLFQTGSKVGAYLAGASQSSVDQIGQCSLSLGIAFQIVDDILDIVGHEDLLGKPTGIDLRDGNPSIPIILALKEGHKAVFDAFQDPSASEGKIHEAIRAIRQGSSIQKARVLSKTYAEQALKTIENFPASEYRDSLQSAVRLIVDRES
jgi:geranylgeranyl pyrophosphate synthase